MVLYGSYSWYNCGLATVHEGAIGLKHTWFAGTHNRPTYPPPYRDVYITRLRRQLLLGTCGCGKQAQTDANEAQDSSHARPMAWLMWISIMA